MEQQISYILAGSELVDEYQESDYMSAVKNINNGEGVLIEYDHSRPIGILLDELDGNMGFCEITKDEAEAIKSHLE